MNAQDAAHNILVDLNAKRQSELLGNSRTTPGGIPLFHFHDGVDEFLIRSRWAGPTPTLGSEQHAVLCFFGSLWRRSKVEGFITMAERSTRAGRMKRVHKPARIRSAARRLGARLRPRLRISS